MSHNENGDAGAEAVIQMLRELGMAGVSAPATTDAASKTPKPPVAGDPDGADVVALAQELGLIPPSDSAEGDDS